MVVRLTNDIDAVQDLISSLLLGLLMDVITLAGMLAVMLYLDWTFTLAALSIAPLLFVVVYRLTRRIKKATRAVCVSPGSSGVAGREPGRGIRRSHCARRPDRERQFDPHRGHRSTRSPTILRSTRSVA